MAEEIIIDGVNVAGCEYCFKRDNTVCCSDYITGLCEDYNCRYKQLKRLEQENNSLQAQLNNITVQTNNTITALEQENKQIKSALEKINRTLLGVRGLSINCDKQIIKVKAIINEVLNA